LADKRFFTVCYIASCFNIYAALINVVGIKVLEVIIHNTI